MVFLARGDLEGARAFLREASHPTDLDEFIAQFSVFDDLYWVLDNEWQERLLGFDLEPFGGLVIDRSIAFAHTYHLRGDQELATQHAERARAELAERLEEYPDDPDINPLMGVALAYLGRHDEALEYGRKGVALYEASPDVPYPYSRLQLVRIHALFGEIDPAIDNLEPLLEAPFYITPGWLRIDPMFDPLRDHPRFQALIESSGLQPTYGRQTRQLTSHRHHNRHSDHAVGHLGRSGQHIEIRRCDIREVGVVHHRAEELGPGVVLHRLLVPPDINPAVGARLRLASQILHSSPGTAAKRGQLIAQPGVVRVAHPCQTEIDDLDVHISPPFGRPTVHFSS